MQPAPKPVDPAKRALAIQSAIAKRKIKRNNVTDDILLLLSQMIEEKSAC